MIGFLYSVISYAGFLAVFTYFAWFSAGAFVPRSVNYMRCQASTPKFLPIGAPVPPRSTEQGAA
ncbi:MAG: hypothetical protein OXR73_31745 [Myxococcales bacterium]|nr:hypothetical protein [Myxococcales bacterium]